MAVGSVAAIMANVDYELSQLWSRYFYETSSHFPNIDGLIYSNAHNGEDAVALYERCKEALECRAGGGMRLDGPPSLVAEILQIADRHNMFVL